MKIKQLKILVGKALNLKAIFRAHSVSYCVRTGAKKNPRKTTQEDLFQTHIMSKGWLNSLLDLYKSIKKAYAIMKLGLKSFKDCKNQYAAVILFILSNMLLSRFE